VASIAPAAPELALAIDLCNTYDLLENPPDILRLDLLRRVADTAGRLALVEGLRDSDLPALRELRGGLYQVFAQTESADKVAAINAVLDRASARAQIVDGRLHPVGGPDPLDRLAAALAGALAHAIADGDPGRLRLCAADPCRCVYMDRTRANRQRYCCDLCNDRMAAKAYRRRQA
jgi:predicted RNA-binding Zn ribbon-like protein